MVSKKTLNIEKQVSSVTVEKIDELKNVPICTKVRAVFSKMTVEPILVCYLLSNVLASFTSHNLTLEKACRVNLGFDKDTCDALSVRNQSHPGFRTSEESVQGLAANMAIWKNMFQGIVSSFVLLFLGSWSDKHKKRKPLILNPILGDIATYNGLIVSIMFFYELPLEFNILVESIPYILTGGIFSMYAGVHTYVSGVSSQESRTNRFGSIQIATTMSVTAGLALWGILYHMIGFYGVFSTCLAILFFGYVYGLFFVKEIDELGMKEKEVAEEKRGKKKSFLLDFCDIKHVADTFKIAFRKREGNMRSRICWLLVLSTVLSGPITGENNVTYYYVRYKFGWDTEQSSMFLTFRYITQTLGALIEVMSAATSITMKSILSKSVTTDELGKIHSLSGLADASIPLLYGPLYSKIYAATISFFPGAFYMTSAVLTIPAVLIYVWLYMEFRKDEKEEQSRVQEVKLLSLHESDKT
ncbi:probable peptidoglycan muropeptide transporter SLC46 isoform X2 [Leptinotarsa decemlineata]|uniref:probable peptidoglycan muropeptide transporter SLC46 isoform X2 n=1 Tax=Leptinotarsa decemlineata TaxID=7539 RepID=UPI003D30B0BE